MQKYSNLLNLRAGPPQLTMIEFLWISATSNVLLTRLASNLAPLQSTLWDPNKWKGERDA